MGIQIYCTSDGTTTYPLHNHSDYEIIYYLQGEGFLKTEKYNIPYTPGTIIIVPPNLKHGSASEKGFKNISVNGSFKNLFNFNEPIVMSDNENADGRLFAKLLYENRFHNNAFLSSLCETYVLFLLTNFKIDKGTDIAIKKIIAEISENAFDQKFDVASALHKSGYAEDYIRNKFRQMTGKTPTQFLTDIRINRACFLIEIYNTHGSISEIAEQCGFVDYAYFSKRFKQIIGLSPSEYKKQILV